MKNRSYVWQPQSVVARDILSKSGLHAAERNAVQAINSPYHIAGHTGGTFIVVKNHAAPVPTDILEQARICRMVVITIDDEFAREAAYQRLDHVLGN